MADQFDAERRIRELEDRRYSAIIAGDLITFSSLCHPDLLYTHSNGFTHSLESYLEKVREGFYVYHNIEHPIHRLIVAGDSAVVLGEMNAQLISDGVETELRNSSLAVWVRHDGDWRLLAYQATPKP